MSQDVILYTSSTSSSAKMRSQINTIRHILTAKKIDFEEVDLTMRPYRRQEMLANSNGNTTIPQLHAYGRYIGTAGEVQELEDWGDLIYLLQGKEPPPPVIPPEFLQQQPQEDEKEEEEDAA